MLARQQCIELRRRVGIKEDEAAVRLQMAIPSLRKALSAYKVEPGSVIPFTVFQKIAQRRNRAPGQKISQVAAHLRVSLDWIMEQIDKGLVRPTEMIWDSEEIYFTKPMVQRLKTAASNCDRDMATVIPAKPTEWLRVSQAGFEAGVSISTIAKWAKDGALKTTMSPQGCLYLKASVRKKAREFWRSSRFKRANPPAWLSAGQAHGA